MEFLIIFVVFGLLMFMMSRGQKKMMAQQNERRQEALVVGNTVQTHSGAIGKIVDIDGGVVTLESASGDESQWLTTAVASVIEPPYESQYADTDVDEFDREFDDTYSDDDNGDGLTPRDSDLNR